MEAAGDHGFEKGVSYAKELGAEADHVRRHSTVIFPFYTQTGKAGSPRSEFQIRVPIDDTHTYHICYQVYAAPPEVAVPPQEVVPWYEPPLVDEQGRRILDYVLGQDMTVWTAQGEGPFVVRRRLVQTFGGLQPGGQCGMGGG